MGTKTTGRLYRGFTQILTDQLVVSAGNFITTLFCARLLGPDDFGLYSASYLFVLFSSSLLLPIAGIPLLSHLPETPEDNRRSYISGSLRTYWIASLSFCAASVAIYFILADLITTHSQSDFLVFPTALAVAFHNWQETLRRIDIALCSYRSLLVSDTLNNGTRLLLIAVAHHFDSLTPEIAVTIFAACSALSGITSRSRIKLYPKPSDIAISWKINSKSSKWLTLTGILQWTSTNLFLATSALILAPATLGKLRVCHSTAALLNVAIQAGENYIPSKIASVYMEGGLRLLKRYLIILTCIIFAIITITILSATVGGQNLLVTLYGTEYDGLSQWLLWALISQLMALFFPLIRASLTTLAIANIWFYSYLTASTFSLLSVYWFIRDLDGLGVLIGMATSNLIIIAVSSIGLWALTFRRKP